MGASNTCKMQQTRVPGAQGCSLHAALVLPPDAAEHCGGNIGGWWTAWTRLDSLFVPCNSCDVVQVLPPDVAQRCEGTIGGWCGRYLLQDEIPTKVGALQCDL